MYSDILNLIHTQSDRQLVIEGLDDLVATLYTTNSFEALAQSKFPSNFLPFLKKDLNFLEDLKKTVSQMKVLDIYLALTPSMQIQDTIYFWVKKNLSPNVYVNIYTNPDLIAGAQIDFQGKSADFTIRKYLTTL